MDISSVTSSYWTHVEQSNKSKSALKSTFYDALNNEKSVNNADVSDEPQAVTTVKDAREASEPIYTVTEEEAEYFRKKYGEEYNDDNQFRLFDELAEKNIISAEDSYKASRKNRIGLIEGLPDLDTIHRLIAENGGHYCFDMKVIYNESYFPDNGNNTYDEFRRSKNTPINTWQDYVQDNYDYYQYLMENYTMLRNFAGEPYVTDVNGIFSSRCESAERVQKVLSQIFG